MTVVEAVVVEVHKFKATVVLGDNGEIKDILEYGKQVEDNKDSLYVDKILENSVWYYVETW